jgi:hypothetical protein
MRLNRARIRLEEWTSTANAPRPYPRERPHLRTMVPELSLEFSR